MRNPVAGIVLAGGKSSRMGTSKALLSWQGTPLVEHMRSVLHQAGCAEVFISGVVDGYETIPDAIPYEGPAYAIAELQRRFYGSFTRLLFVPVDMPLLTGTVLRTLIDARKGAYYESQPLPAILETRTEVPNCRSVRELLAVLDAEEIPLPADCEKKMININTQAEWEAVSS